jgi:DNA modification methylase
MASASARLKPEFRGEGSEKVRIKIRDRIVELRRVRAKDLVPHPKNWRVHSKAQAAALRGLLAEVGYADALLGRELSDGKLQIIDGHLRAETTPNAMVPVLILDVTEAEAEKILLTLDPLAAMAEADSEQIRELLETVRTDSAAVGELIQRVAGQNGIRALNLPGAVLDPDAEIDRAAELQKKWSTAPGQVWQIGPHRLGCADSRNRKDVARLWVGHERPIRMVWTDPPYGIDYVKTKNDALRHLHKGTTVKTDIANDSLSPKETHELFRKALAIAVERAEKGAACYATVASGPSLVGFIQAFEAAGFSFKHHLVWVKQQLVIGRCDYHYRHEPILYGWLENGPHYFSPDRTHDTVFEIDKPATSSFHSTTKPTALIAEMIANSSLAGELVYDPFFAGRDPHCWPPISSAVSVTASKSIPNISRSRSNGSRRWV